MKLSAIQLKLKAPKTERNNFGNYQYRTVSGILEAVKPLMEDGDKLVLSDEVVEIGGRVYVKAYATYTDKDGETETATGYAREQESKKGMDESQITGAASTYARKYALNGLFAIDDSELDPDATNTHGHQEEALNAARIALNDAIKAYCERHDADLAKISAGIAKRPDYEPTIEFYTKAAKEFQEN